MVLATEILRQGLITVHYLQRVSNHGGHILRRLGREDISRPFGHSAFALQTRETMTTSVVVRFGPKMRWICKHWIG
jgi:hypothetical protein